MRKRIFGNAVIAASDNCTKWKSDDDEDDVIDISNSRSHLSAAHHLENKTPVEADTAPTKKRRSTPPKQGRLLSVDQVREMYPGFDHSDSDEDDFDDDVSVAQAEKVSEIYMFRLIRMTA